MQLDSVLADLLKHKRILILALDNESPIVLDAIIKELKKIEPLTTEIEKLLKEIREKILS